MLKRLLELLLKLLGVIESGVKGKLKLLQACHAHAEFKVSYRLFLTILSDIFLQHLQKQFSQNFTPQKYSLTK